MALSTDKILLINKQIAVNRNFLVEIGNRQLIYAKGQRDIGWESRLLIILGSLLDVVALAQFIPSCNYYLHSYTKKPFFIRRRLNFLIEKDSVIVYKVDYAV